MRSLVISLDSDTLMAFRLSGMEGIRAKDTGDGYDKLTNALNDKEIGLIIIDESILLDNKAEIMELKLKTKNTLIIHIPEKEGLKEKDFILRYIRESIGVKV